MSKDYKDYIDLHHHSSGDERRLEMLSDILKSGAFLPHTVEYEDIDKDFKRWVEEELVLTSDDGKEFPTMVLFSNQRFSEYTQSWEFTDANNNILLNFKSITRENNPQFGKIQNGFWNIPGKDRFYTMKKQLVLDDNGTESLLVLKMRQPVAIDLMYKITIFTTQYHSINDFNMMINELFSARQCYLQPNHHFMPMTLENIGDESSYNIDDRQFYAQSYQIKAMTYIITKDDYRVEQVPYKRGITLTDMISTVKIKPEVDIEECEIGDDVTLTITYPEKCYDTTVSFTMDTDVTLNKITVENLYNNYEIYVNNASVDKTGNIKMFSGDEIKIRSHKQLKQLEAKMILNGKINIFSNNALLS